MTRRPPNFTLFPYRPLSRSRLRCRSKIIRAVSAAKNQPTRTGPDLPGKTNSRSKRVLSVGIIAKPVVDASYARGKDARKVRRNDIPRNTAGWRRVGISLGDVETGISAELVGKLAQTFVTKADV